MKFILHSIIILKIFVTTSHIQINEKFKELQTTVETEFASNDHRTKCQKLFLKTLRYDIKIHPNEIRFIVNTKSLNDLMKQRTFSIHNLLLLRKIVYDCAKTDDEKAVGISQIYMSLTEGGYRNALRDCLIWHLIKNEHDFTWIVFSNDDYYVNSIVKYPIHTIKKYFEKRKIDPIYFEGWNSTIRNAVAHSTFHYDRITKKIIYDDVIGNRIESSTIDEMSERCDNLWAVFELVFIRNQILRVNDIIDVLRIRHHIS